MNVSRYQKKLQIDSTTTIENFTLEKRKKLCEELNVGEKVLILAERLKKKSAPGKFYKQFVQNISYFNKGNVFIVTNKRKIEDKTFYWLKKTQKRINISTKVFKDKKVCAILNNFK